MKYNNRSDKLYETDEGRLDTSPEKKIKDSHPKLTLVHQCCQTGHILPSASNKINYPGNEGREEGQDQCKTSSWYEAPSSLSVYLKTISGFCLLTEAEERTLAKRIKECEEECKQLVIQWKHMFLKKFSSKCNQEINTKLQQINASLHLFDCLAELEKEREIVSGTLKKGIKNSKLQEKLQEDLYKVEAGIAKCIAKISCSNDHITRTVYNLIQAIPQDNQCAPKQQDVENDLKRKLKQISELAKDIKELKSELVHANQKLVTDIAKKYSHYGLELPDLIQEGNLGLLRAIDTFDYRRGYRFMTYAIWWIRQAIIRALQCKLRTIRKPIGMNEKLSKIVKTSKRLFHECKREPTVEEIAEEMNVSLESIEKVTHSFKDTVSMDSLIEEGRERESNLSFNHKRNPILERVILSSLSKVIHVVLSELTQQEKEVVSLRFGIGGCDHHTLEEIGVKFDFTRERSRQVLESALIKIRKSTHMIQLKDFKNIN